MWRLALDRTVNTLSQPCQEHGKADSKEIRLKPRIIVVETLTPIASVGVHVRFETTGTWEAFIALGTVVDFGFLVTGRLLAGLEASWATKFLRSNEVGVRGPSSDERSTSSHESVYKARILMWKMAEELAQDSPSLMIVGYSR
jgi:hypothetical protein